MDARHSASVARALARASAAVFCASSCSAARRASSATCSASIASFFLLETKHDVSHVARTRVKIKLTEPRRVAWRFVRASLRVPRRASRGAPLSSAPRRPTFSVSQPLCVPAAPVNKTHAVRVELPIRRLKETHQGVSLALKPGSSDFLCGELNKTRCHFNCPYANKNKLTSAAAASNAARSSASTSSSCSRCAALARALTPLLSDRSGMTIEWVEWEDV